MKFGPLLATCAAVLTVSAQESLPEGSSLSYLPAVPMNDMAFANEVLRDPIVQSLLSRLPPDERGNMDEAIERITRLGTRAQREADAVSQEDWPVRKNVLNYLRDTVVLYTREWCRPKHSWFCNQKFLDEALTFIDTRFCSSYTKEMRRETCLPEARYDYNRAHLTRTPPI